MLEQQLAEHFRTVPIDPEIERRVQQAVLSATGIHRTSRRRLIAATGGAILLVLVLVGVLVRVSTAPRPGGRPAGSQASLHQLYTQTWTDRASGTDLVFRKGFVVIADGCSEPSYAMTITGDRLHLGQQIDRGTNCSGTPVQPSGQAAEQRAAAAALLLVHVLRSSPRWVIGDGILSLTHGPTTIRLTDVVPVIGSASPVVSPTSSPTPAALAQPCTADALTLTRSTSMAGMFKYIEIFALHNTGGVSCTLAGYPQMKVYNSGVALSDPIRYEDNFYGIRVHTVTLAPGESAGVYVGAFPSPNATSTCPTAQHPSISLTPPGTNRPLSTSDLQLLPICTDGSETLYVSPIHSGTRAP